MKSGVGLYNPHPHKVLNVLCHMNSEPFLLAILTHREKVYVKQGEYVDVDLGRKPVPNIFAASLYILLISSRKQDSVNFKW